MDRVPTAKNRLTLFGMPLLTARVSIFEALSWWCDSTGAIFRWLQHVI